MVERLPTVHEALGSITPLQALLVQGGRGGRERGRRRGKGERDRERILLEHGNTGL